MLLHLLERLQRQRLVLASSSPRRREILSGLGLKFRVVPSTFAEDLDKKTFATPAAYVAETARRKTLEVFEKEKDNVDLVIGADTIVVLGSSILEKPQDIADAKRMLSALSNNTHTVFTAVTLAVKSSSEPFFHVFVEETKVTFAALSEREIDAYIATNEPFDKAGGYGIQGLGSSLVKSIEGCYFNVVGFPTHRFCQELSKLVDSNVYVLRD